MGLSNTTTTFAQSWGTPKDKVMRLEVLVQVTRLEVLVLFSAFTWTLIEWFGSSRRRHSNGLFRFFVWAVYTVFSVLGPYTIGLLQDGPFRDQTFVLWATIILLIQVSADSISVYSIQDIEQRKRGLVQHMLQIIFVLWLIVNCNGHNKSYIATIWIFWIQSIILVFRKSRTLSNVSKKGGLLKQSKVVADYMMIEHEQIAQDGDGVTPNPKTMQGYRYIFRGEEEVASLLPTAPEYRVLLEDVARKCTTIDSVWQEMESQSGYTLENMGIMKDIALSFTLFKLLKRRLCGYGIGEARLTKTLHFVLHGLISEEGNYVRAFRVVETELAFLYDFLFTRFDMKMRPYKHWAKFFLLIVTVWNCISGAFSRHYHRSNWEQRFHKIDVIHLITIVLFSIVLLMSWVPFSYHSRWQLLYFQGRRTQSCLSSIIDDVKLEAKEYWQRALGQYSLLDNFDYCPWNLLPLLSLGLVDATRDGQKAGKKVVLTDEVIVRVLSGFKESNGQIQDGQSAVARNQLESHFSWACTLPTHIHKILIWHIGTTIAMDGHQDPLTGDDYHVAKTLSNYCAYLIAFVPEMLPGHSYDNQRIFDAVVIEARGSLTDCDTVGSRCEKLTMMVLPCTRNCNILELGARLGRELRGVVPEARRWKVLADFWADFILFLAPSSNVDIHVEKLAAGGEFMTHLWALLTHAGILERPPNADGVGGNHGTSAHDSLV